MPNKKILFVEFLPIGGSTVALGNLVDFIVEKRRKEYEPIILASRNSIISSVSERNKIQIYYLKGEATELSDFKENPIKCISGYLSTLFSVFKVVLKERPKLIYTNHYMWSVYTNPVGFLLGIQVIINLCDVWMLKPRVSRFLMKFNKQTKYIAVSKFVYNQFTNIFKVSKISTKLIYDGSDTNLFSPLSDGEFLKKYKSKEKIITYFSRITPERDVEIFIDTASILLNEYKNLTFYHCGYDPKNTNRDYFDILSKRVKGLGISANFKFIKYFDSTKNIAKIMKKSFLTMVPARQFAIPNVAIESMMCGTPVVAYNTGGNPEIIANNKMGTLINVNSPVMYARATEEYLSNEKKYINACAESVFYSQKHFPILEKHNKIMKFIDQVLS